MKSFSNLDTVSERAAMVGLPPSKREVFGRLQFDPDADISLQILDRGDIEQALEGTGKLIPTILGQLDHGPPFTLVDCMVVSANFGGGGFADIKIVANQLLVGMHLPDPTAKPFDEIRVSITNLNEWFAISPIQHKLEEVAPPGVGRQLTVLCKHSSQIGFSPRGGGPSFASEQLINYSYDFPDRGIVTNQFELCLHPRAPFGLEESVTELFRLQAFMSILCGQQVFFQHVHLYLKDTEAPSRQEKAVEYMPRFARPVKAPKKLRPDQIFLPLPMIRDSLPTLWSAWTKRYESYRSAVELFTSTELFGGQLPNFQLLAIMQALETLHRNRFGGKYESDETYQLIADALNKAIPNGVADDLRSALKAKLKYGNEYSLRKRIRNLAEGLPGGVNGKVCTWIHASMQEFLNQSVDTRNYFTHFTDELEPNAFRDAELLWATRLLRWLFVAVLLHDMGLPERNLIDALNRAEDLRHARQSLTKTRKPPGVGIKTKTTEAAKTASAGGTDAS
jgi:hypothetical protein